VQRKGDSSLRNLSWYATWRIRLESLATQDCLPVRALDMSRLPVSYDWSILV
jgi:hypothetical protein